MFKKRLYLAVLLACALPFVVAETGKTQAEQDFVRALSRLKNHVDTFSKAIAGLYRANYFLGKSADEIDVEKVTKEVLLETVASVKQMIGECYQQTDIDERKLCPYMDIQFQYAEPLYTFQAPKKDKLDGLRPETRAWIQNHPEETGMAYALLDTLSKKVKQ